MLYSGAVTRGRESIAIEQVTYSVAMVMTLVPESEARPRQPLLSTFHIVYGK